MNRQRCVADVENGVSNRERAKTARHGDFHRERHLTPSVETGTPQTFRDEPKTCAELPDFAGVWGSSSSKLTVVVSEDAVVKDTSDVLKRRFVQSHSSGKNLHRHQSLPRARTITSFAPRTSMVRGSSIRLFETVCRRLRVEDHSRQVSLYNPGTRGTMRGPRPSLPRGAIHMLALPCRL